MGSTVGAVFTGGTSLIPGVGAALEDVSGIDFGQEGSADRALAAQQGAARDANSTQLYMYNQTRADQEPWRQAGGQAIGQMQNADFQRDFTAADFRADPGYDFRMKEGMKALQNSAAARGGLGGGATMKAITGFGQNLATEEYGKAYDRFNADRDRRFNRLASLSGSGQTAANTVGQAGQNYANAYGANVTGAANAQAGQAIAQANQRSQLVGQGLTAAMMFSDERLKHKVRRIPKEELDEMRRALVPYLFEYIQPQFGSGEYVGVMAQDLEKSKLGRTLVFENAEGFKQIDLSRVLMLFLATQAEAS